MLEIEHIVEWVEYSSEEIEEMTDVRSKNYLRDLLKYMNYTDEIRRLINISRALFIYHKFGYNDMEISEITNINISSINTLRKRNNLKSNYAPSQKGKRREDHK